ncbi:NnrU family protein [Allorhizobium sp. BGMRC 0089]|uniref:NnrU family protein n=1 Tax=Allorhizobium sonneratiae TaxID=2934936 RepID=UPI0020335386|nr:NnrU family protein [Allorhizobium sonneratiae]MCM2291150.1 NnrU family protein [Allorhizobium sonneratiae]
MTLLIVGLVLFLGLHLVRVVAPGFRSAMVGMIGLNGWKGLYSLVALVALALIAYGYSLAPVVNVWFPPPGMNHLTVTLMLIATICLVASLLPAGQIAAKTKHPMVLAIKIWAFAHLLSNGDLRSILLFASFLAWGVILRIALKRRERAGELVRPPFVSARYDAYAVIIGLVVWAAITFKLHELIIGVSPLAM